MNPSPADRRSAHPPQAPLHSRVADRPAGLRPVDQGHPVWGRRPLVDPVSPELDRAEIDALLRAGGSGDLEALAAFYDLTAPVIYGLLRAVLGEPGAAERAVRRVYLQLWRIAPQFDPTARSGYALALFTARRELIARVHDLLTPPVAG